jgi:two-component system, LytTR family, response regulator
MNILIIDDDITAAETLARELSNYADVSIVGKANTGSKGFNIANDKRPELIFLDVELPDMSGLNFIDKIKAIPDYYFKVVIYSSYEKYMLDAFRMSAFDYLLKPIDNNNLNVIMERFYTSTHVLDTQQEPNVPKNQRLDKFLLYTNSLDFILAKPQNIGLFHYNHKRKIWEVVVEGKLGDIALKHSVTSEMILKLSKDFIQVHQSYIINLNYLIEVIDNVCHFYPPFDKINYVTVGRIFRKKIIDRFCSL